MLAVAVDLPIIEGTGLAVERRAIEQFKASLGVTIIENHFDTLIERAIIELTSGLDADGRSLSCTLASKMSVDLLAWEQFKPVAAMRRLLTVSGGANPASNESKKLQELLKDKSSEHLMDALSGKVSSIAMLDRDEVIPNRSLLEYGLDSLFPLELRNWIRRSLDVDIALKNIATAIHLKALVDHILSLMKSTVSDFNFSYSKSLVDAAVDGELVSGSFSPAVKGVVSQAIPLSTFQRLLLLSDGPEEPTSKATTSAQYPFENPRMHVTAARIEGALLKLVDHHPILHNRLQQRKGDGAWVQEIPSASRASLLLRVHTLQSVGEILNTTAQLRSEPAHDTMLVANLILSLGRSLLILTPRYIVVDGVSAKVLNIAHELESKSTCKWILRSVGSEPDQSLTQDNRLRIPTCGDWVLEYTQEQHP